MKEFAMLKFSIAMCLGLSLSLGACDKVQTPKPAEITQTEARGLPPLADYISCLPRETALAAAHRGTAKNTKYPENSVSALNRLIEEGYLVTEIDVAGLKDGVHILYHDGVWDDKSTGRGPIASSTWADAGKILLKDTNGNPSSERPVKFEDYLLAAKGKIYLEIDFKSSSKYERVIKLIRKHKLADQVILISYSQGQTRKLSRLAPDMMISISPDEALGQRQFKSGQVAAWVGYNLDDKNLIENLRDKNIPVLGRIRKKWNIRSADAADILVTDNIFDMNPVIGLTKNNRSELENCLEKL